ncbi:MAG: PEP-CTERM sorting domain-containing protein, partial [Phycisphaerales bacterium]
RSLRTFAISGLAAVASISLVDKVDARVVSGKQIDYGYRIIDGTLDEWSRQQKQYSLNGQLSFSRGGRDLTGYYLMAYHSQWWAQGNFNEGENIEWIYENLENQYNFLDVTLYKLLGGNYLLGPPTNPSWHGFRDFYWAKDLARQTITLPEDKVSPQWIDFWGTFSFFGEPAEPGDQLSAHVGNVIVGEHVVSDEGWYELRIFVDRSLTAYINGAVLGDMMTFVASDRRTGKMYPVEILRGAPRWTYHGGRIRVDINAVPEPSSIGLFGLAVLGVLLHRRRTPRI